MKKNVMVIIVIVAALIVGGGIFLFMRLGESLNTNSSLPTNVTNSSGADNANGQVNSDTNAPAIGNIITDAETTMTGTVFIKGYGTPSESYGIITADNYEIGLGKYDSMKEKFRPYVAEKVSVTFSTICRSTSPDCCLTVFYYCGTVKEWEPLTTNQ